MENLMRLMDAVKDYNIEVCKGMNTLTRDIAMLHFDIIEHAAFRKSSKKDFENTCDDAEKGLTCAMPL